MRRKSARFPREGEAMSDGKAKLLGELADLLGDRLCRSTAIRDTHSHGEGYNACHPPDAVAFPETTAEVAAIVRLCSAAEVPIVPFGAGTSLEGQVAAIAGGICLNMTGMNRIVSVVADDLDCRVEAGVTREQLNLHLRDMGLFFPLDPGANATLGGMAATRASGTNAVRYGTMREVVLGLTVVTPDGTIIETGGKARKSSAGYDLTRLYVGSEGTLGVITEVQLRLFGIPEAIASGVVQFADVGQAVQAVIATIQMGIPVARIELLDEVQLAACISFSKLADMEPKATLFVEFHGSPAGVADQIAQAGALFAQYGGSGIRWAEAEDDRRRLWKARHDAFHAAKALKPGCDALATDACVPISRLAECIAEARQAAAASDLTCPLVGHVGDGNFHMLLLYDPAKPHERAKAEALSEIIARIAIRMGGTCTGEHGVGLHKRAVAAEEAGESAQVMRAIKQALDPRNIMNPGKTLPLADGDDIPRAEVALRAVQG
jgi:D-lactate dehydrogenase (cytochrome)